ncbi:MAG TPA: NTP transferase domain-containing protein, partial [Allosphingosinicella sp.]|nr:NTP transferase domain-containing protein [Allosphingosinicella sp.]
MEGATALLLAGRRPGLDPLAAHFAVEDKALIAVAGEPMVSRVARTLADHARIRRIVVLSQEPEKLIGAGTGWMAKHPKIAFEASGASISASVGETVVRHSDGFPFLITTADNVLLDRTTLEEFSAG